MAGDDQAAKEKVATLVRDGGLNPVDAGGLNRARELEALGLLHMQLQQPLGTGFASAVKILA
jgi:8-hydroxy-5-deazaflavin:NADPH oxidoreductase